MSSFARRISGALSISISMLLALFLLVRADDIPFSDVLEERFTNWSDELIIPQFNPELGILREIDIQIDGTVTGIATFENIGPSSAPVTMTHNATLTISLPNGEQITSIPSASFSADIPQFDGINDKDGPSGRELRLSDTISTSIILTTPEALTPFIGTETVSIPFDAKGFSAADGPGNFSAVLRANASGSLVNIRYNFAVPNIDIETYTNDNQADGANDPDVPEIAVGDLVRWTYEIQNTGDLPFTRQEVSVTDSVSTVQPSFDSTSDDGDNILSPGEIWTFRASGVAEDYMAPSAGTPLEAGCDSANTSFTRPTYVNVGTVTAQGLSDADPTHHCNPSNAIVTIEKQINGVDADQSTDPDIPYLTPGATINWLYQVQNNGPSAIALADLVVTDSDPNVSPILLTTSDEGGDQLLSSDESWTYTAMGTAQNLARPEPGTTIVRGCGPNVASANQFAYRSVAAVVAEGEIDIDLTHYCNTLDTTLTIETRTNGIDADDPAGADVPQLTPGDPVTWTYEVQNSGQLTVALVNVLVTDDQPNIVPVLDPTSDVGNDEQLSPDETWIYSARGTVQYLQSPSVGIIVTDSCNPSGVDLPRTAYQSVGRVTLGAFSASDNSHYCNALAPNLELDTLTNGVDADEANGADVPQLTSSSQIISRASYQLLTQRAMMETASSLLAKSGGMLQQGLRKICKHLPLA